MAGHANARQRLLEPVDLHQRPLHIRFLSHDADAVLHRFLQLHLKLVRVFALFAAIEGRERVADGALHGLFVHARRAVLAGELSGVSPARLPNTMRSDSEFPPRRFAPLMPEAHSPAANRPGTDDICESASTRTPPMM